MPPIERECVVRGGVADLLEMLAGYGDSAPLSTVEALVEGPAGCVRGDTVLDGNCLSIKEMADRNIRPIVRTLAGCVLADVPFKKGTAKLYRVTTQYGRQFVATADHLCFADGMWKYVCDLLPGISHLLTYPEDAPHWTNIAQDFLDRCFACFHQCGGQPLSDPVYDQFFSPLRFDVLSLGHDDLLHYGQASTVEHIHPYPTFFLPATQDSAVQTYSAPWDERHPARSSIRGAGFHAASCTLEHACDLYELSLLSHQEYRHDLPFLRPNHGFWNKPSHLANVYWEYSSTNCRFLLDRVASINFIGCEDYYDLNVPFMHHYFAGGLLHHNTGKTYGILTILHDLCDRIPNMRVLFGRKTRKSMTQSVLATFEEFVLPPGHQARSAAKREQRSSYHYPNGSEIVCGGFDDPERIKSTDYDIIYVNEATELTENDWETGLSRCRHDAMGWHLAICDANPVHPSHWLNQRPNMDAADEYGNVIAGERRMTRFISRHEDNPVFHDGRDWTRRGRAYLRTLERLTGVRYKRLRLGQWCASEGMVYDGWDADKLVIDKPLSEIKYYVVSVDWGYRDPGVFQVWGVDGDKTMYRVAEIYRTGETIDWWLDRAKEIEREYQPVAWVPDPAEPGYIDQLRRTVRRVQTLKQPPMTDMGVRDAAFKPRDIRLGIDTVMARMRDQGNGRRGIYWIRDALRFKDDSLATARQPFCSEQEIESYVYEQPKDGKPNKETPLDMYNHAMDAMRYAVMFIEQRGTGTVATYRSSV